MNKQPEVSIVMPTYNGEQNILEQLETLRTQSYPVKEVIMSDDGSTDNTVKIVKKYIEEYDLYNWHILENETNLGWRINFFNLLNMANGDIIFTSDQDDVWYENKIAQMVKVFNNPQVNVLVSDYDELIEPGGVSFPCSQRVIKNVDSEGKIQFSKKNVFLDRPGWVYALRKSFLPEINLYKEHAIVPVHDITMWSTAVLTDSLYHLDVSTGKWRKHGDSAIRNENVVDLKKGRYGIRLGKLNRLHEITQSNISYLSKTNFVVNNKKKKLEVLQQLLIEYEARREIVEAASITKLLANLSSYTALHPILADTVFLIKNK